jgi:hypothetical protein
MLRELKHLVAVLCLLSLIAGCGQRKPSYHYLMLHPHYLQDVYNQCVEEAAKTAWSCQTIMRAQADFMALSYQREQDAEGFGAQILQAEENSAFLKQKLHVALQAYKPLPNSQDLKKRHLELDKAQNSYKASLEKVEVLLAVVAATSVV